ncbi:MAG: SLATT domain-containing protein [Actinomycetota bacterium]
MAEAGVQGTAAQAAGPATGHWGEAQVELLKDWRQRSAAASESHYRLATVLRRKNLSLGVPAAVFAAIVGTSLFATLQETSQISNTFRVVIGSVSVLAAILAGLQTFLRFGERAEKHVVAADWYAAIRRDIDEVVALPASARGEPRDALDRVRKEMSKVGQQSPEIPSSLWERVARRYHVPLGPLGAPIPPP